MFAMDWPAEQGPSVNRLRTSNEKAGAVPSLDHPGQFLNYP